MRKKIYIVLYLLFFCVLFEEGLLSKEPPVEKPEGINFTYILGGLQRGDQSILKAISYNNLQRFSAFIRRRVEKEESSFVSVLYADDRKGNQRNVVSAFLGGFLNPDPKVRLHCAHVILKLGVKREWIEIAVQKALDPIGEVKETVDDYYFYTDIYGRSRKENIKYSLPRLLELGSHIVLLAPQDNIKIARRQNFFFEWSSIYEADSYEFYIGDILYYSGKETFAYIKKELDRGPVKWTVIAKDFWDRYITREQGIFYIVEASLATDDDVEDGGQGLDFDISDFE